MPTSIKDVSKWMTVVAIATLGFSTVRDARPAQVPACASGVMVKNLVALSARPCNTPAAAPREITINRKRLKKLIATAKSSQDHLKLADYYRTKADNLDAEGKAYEEAAAAYRQGPIVKNLMALNTAARYESLAKGFREEAKSTRALAASHEQMARSAVAKP